MKEIIKEIKKTFYVAADGIEFETKEACQDYETNRLSKYITLFDDCGKILDPSSVNELDDIFGIVFHKTDGEFVNDVLDYFKFYATATNNMSTEELYYINQNNQIILIYSNTYDEWINPPYRIKTYIEETSNIAKKEIKL